MGHIVLVYSPWYASFAEVAKMYSYIEIPLEM